MEKRIVESGVHPSMLGWVVYAVTDKNEMITLPKPYKILKKAQKEANALLKRYGV